ncbi:prolyl oligopeptidase family serine peptidase [Nitrogeniibacter mangrovi]|uniref:Prolyl oligopeptidase family serine peptidase n=1 Tax=Nitrogeniibacter mangrovi TaxID=2016596 RepID=A0A6C1B5U3_9RHOO|nr:PHB depolymerase family esterase [Nitrogeniibacter mangrovi]QID17670.1 prolyl oligopeptidase family serine peptidase [Nitrogeniibacter mangrovi]
MKRRRNSPLVDALFRLGRTATRAAGKSARHTSRLATDTLAAHAGAAAKSTREALAAVASPAPPPKAPEGGGRWLEGRWGLGPLAMRRYRLYLPPGAGRRRPAPLLLFLHGCQQDSASFAACTRITRFARDTGLAVLMPEQAQEANPQRCWNWFGHEPVVALEAQLIMSIVDHVSHTEPVRADALFAMGLSAGGAMAMSLALRHPTRFLAVASHSGAVATSARTLRQAGQALRGRREPDVEAIHRQLGAHPAPPLLLIQGDRDPVVAPGNAESAAALWLALSEDTDAVRALPPRERTRGARYPLTRLDWEKNGEPYLQLISIHGLGHAWSGGAPGRTYADPAGPDALRLAWAWFAPRLRQVSSAQAQPAQKPTDPPSTA